MMQLNAEGVEGCNCIGGIGRERGSFWDGTSELYVGYEVHVYENAEIRIIFQVLWRRMYLQSVAHVGL